MPLLQSRIENLTIVTKEIGLMPLRLNWAQLDALDHVERQLADTGRVRLIILKARQLGMSTFVEALAYVMCFMIPRYRTLIVTHEKEASENILAMAHLYWEKDPQRALYTPKSESRFELSWKETKSSIKVATAGQKGSAGVGRSKTTHFQHLSEIAFWPDTDSAMLSLQQTLPETPLTVQVVESTANGMGNYFHSQWEAAVAGDIELFPLFYPWWKHPAYTATVANKPIYKLTKLSAEEMLYRKALGVDDDHLLWRRWMIANKCGGSVLKFMQEYPATPEEAFMTSGKNIFDLAKLRSIYKPEDGWTGTLERKGDNVEFSQNPNGPLTVFATPDPNPERGKYLVSGDPTRSTYGDFAVGQVINRRTLEQVAVYRAKVDPTTFGEELFKLGIYYNEALVNNESQGGGYATTATLVTMGYPNLAKQEKPDSSRGQIKGASHGWVSTNKSKGLMIGWLEKLVNSGDLTIHCKHTFSEMKSYVVLPDGTFGPADENNGHDDCVTSLAIGVTTHVLDGVLEPYIPNPAELMDRMRHDQLEGEFGPEHDDDPDWMSWKPK